MVNQKWEKIGSFFCACVVVLSDVFLVTNVGQLLYL